MEHFFFLVGFTTKQISSSCFATFFFFSFNKIKNLTLFGQPRNSSSSINATACESVVRRIQGSKFSSAQSMDYWAY